jgi:hypothetical protein
MGIGVLFTARCYNVWFLDMEWRESQGGSRRRSIEVFQTTGRIFRNEGGKVEAFRQSVNGKVTTDGFYFIPLIR